MSTPLDPALLRAIEECLARGALSQAQQLLRELGDHAEHTSATRYLTTKLLYLRERLAPEEVEQRLQELLSTERQFPEAENLLQVAKRGVRGSLSLPALQAVKAAQEPAHAPETSAYDSTPPAPIGRDTPPNASSPTAATLQAHGSSALPQVDRHSAAHADNESASSPATIPSRQIRVDTREPGPQLQSSQSSLGLATSRAPPGRWGAGSTPEGRYSLSNSQPPPNPDSIAVRKQSTPDSPVRRTPDTQKVPEAPSATKRPQVSRAPLPADAGRYSLRRGLARSGSTPPPEPELLAARQLWSEAELGLSSGNPELAGRQLQSALAQELEGLQLSSGEPPFSRMARSAARFLASAPVLHHFCPFDRSLHSLKRVELAIDVLFGLTPQPDPQEELVLLFGSYIGETLRECHRGRWHGGLDDIRQAQVQAGSHAWEPFEIVAQHVRNGARPPMGSSLKPGLASSGAQAWFSHTTSHDQQPKLWATAPRAARLPLLGAAMVHSIYSLTCRQHFDHALDLSIESLGALDQLLDVLTRTPVPLTGTEVWLNRIGLLAGAYVGEVVRGACGGNWRVDGPGSASGLAEQYVLHLPSDAEATPVTSVISRAVRQKPSRLYEYAQALQRSSLRF